MATTSEPDELVVLVLPNLTVAKGAAARLHTAVHEGRFSALDWVIAEHAEGKDHLHHRSESGAARGFGKGALLGGSPGSSSARCWPPRWWPERPAPRSPACTAAASPRTPWRTSAPRSPAARRACASLDRRMAALTKAVESLPAELRRPLA